MSLLVEKYREPFRLSPVPLLLVDPDGAIQLINDEFEAMFGYASGELVGQAVEALLVPEARGQHPLLRQRFRREPRKRRMGLGQDLEGLTRTGVRIPLELGLEPVQAEGETWVIVSAVEISARRRNERLVTATLNAAASAMIMVNGNGAIVSINPAGLDLFGYEEQELLGQSVEVLLPEALRAQHEHHRAGFFDHGNSRPMGAGSSLFGRHRSGNHFPIEAALTSVDLEPEKLVLATIVDISERLSAERAHAARTAAEAQSRRMEDLNNELLWFAYATSHDLKAPLATMTGVLRVAREDLATGNHQEVAQNLDKLIALGQRSSLKVERMLALARLGYEAGPIEALELKGIVEQLWADLSMNAGDAPELKLDLSATAELSSNRQAVETILENLLTNALKYRTPGPGSWVRVSSRRVHDGFELTVADNGVGIEKDKQEEIFRVFYTLSRASGDGLGLALARRYANNLGGRLSCESEVGVGSAFCLYLPDHGTPAGTAR